MPERPERRYSRLDRVNRLVQEVVADELSRVADERLELVTVTGVRTSADLRHAVVWFAAGTADDERIEQVEVALEAQRVRLQGALGRQLRMKRTPELSFRSDPAIATGSRVEEILRTLRVAQEDRDTPEAEDGSP